jgi:hypothetical protein
VSRSKWHKGVAKAAPTVAATETVAAYLHSPSCSSLSSSFSSQHPTGSAPPAPTAHPRGRHGTEMVFLILGGQRMGAELLHQLVHA